MQEYFLFDPFADYLDPQLQGYRLQRGKYVDIRAVRGRLPSRVLGLHLERHGEDLRLFDPTTGQWLPTNSINVGKEVKILPAEPRTRAVQGGPKLP